MMIFQSKHIKLILISAFIIIVPDLGMATEGHPPLLIENVELPPNMLLCGEPLPMQESQVRERFEKEMLLSLGNRPQIVLWLKRSSRYFPFIEQQLKDARMPDDLKYLAVAESALRPHAGSTKGAVGFWQLMPETARKYGLTVNNHIDERRNLHLSTPAALKYLKTLYQKFNSWTMAIAAYNMGEAGLAAEVLEQDTKNYYHLYLPLETQRFVFRVASIKLILSNTPAYGIKLAPKQRYAAIESDTVTIDCFEEIPIQLIAKASQTYFKTIKDLNPHLRGHYVQPGRLVINIPAGNAKGFERRFEQGLAHYRRELKQRIYIVREGDSLSEIADRFDIPLAAILIWNRLDLNRPIYPGDRLIIYPRRLTDVKP